MPSVTISGSTAVFAELLEVFEEEGPRMEEETLNEFVARHIKRPFVRMLHNKRRRHAAGGVAWDESVLEVAVES